MGFPNEGVGAAAPRLKALSARPRPCIVGVSLGKQKETPLDEAATDYATVMRAVYPYADYLAVNISSPNTPGLRELQGGHYLARLLRAIVAESEQLAGRFQVEPKPLWVKIAPDLDWAELDEILATVLEAGIDGMIVANTTLSREGVTGRVQSEAGGLSGRPLKDRSTAIIDYASRQSRGTLAIIGVGGIATAADVREKLDAGAAVVQLYTGLVYGGPGIAGRILRDLAAGSLA
jgi:dihydroorotate dehydrogenase